MERFALSSSMLTGGFYDPETQRLTVEFPNGRRYEYDAVPPEEVDGLRSAASAGKYFASNIRGSYNGRYV